MKKKSFVFVLIVVMVLPVIALSQTNQEPQLQSRYFFSSLVKGRVLYHDGSIFNYPLNYDLLMNEMIFSPSENKVLAFAQPSMVKEVEIGNYVFIQKNNLFYELIIRDSIALLALHKLNVSADKIGAYGLVNSTSSIDTYTSLDLSYATVKLSPNVKINESKSTVYYLLINNKLKLISNPKNIYKIFPKLKPEIKQFIENRKLSFKEQKSLIEIVEFINQKIK